MGTRNELKELTQEKVLSAAGELFTAHGYRNTTIREIAAQAGVSVGSVMAVGDKQTLLVAIFDRAIAVIHQERAADDPAPPPEEIAGVERVTRLVDPFLNLFADRIDLAREYGAILMSGNHQSTLFGELGDTLRAEIAQEARVTGLNEKAAAEAAKTAYFAYLGTLFFWAARGDDGGAGPRADFMSTLDYIFSK